MTTTIVAAFAAAQFAANVAVVARDWWIVVTVGSNVLYVVNTLGGMVVTHVAPVFSKNVKIDGYNPLGRPNVEWDGEDAEDIFNYCIQDVEQLPPRPPTFFTCLYKATIGKLVSVRSG